MSDDEFLPRIPATPPMLVSSSSLPDSNTHKAGTLLNDKSHHNIIQREWVHHHIQDPPSVESVIELF
jgi:hypothetical protein